MTLPHRSLWPHRLLWPRECPGSRACANAVFPASIFRLRGLWRYSRNETAKINPQTPPDTHCRNGEDLVQKGGVEVHLELFSSWVVKTPLYDAPPPLNPFSHALRRRVMRDWSHLICRECEQLQRMHAEAICATCLGIIESRDELDREIEQLASILDYVESLCSDACE